MTESTQHELDELRAALEEGNAEAVDQYIEELSPGESAHTLSRLSETDQMRLLSLLPEEDAADLLEAIPEAQAAQIVEHLDLDEAAEILNEVESDEQADILGRLSQEAASAVLDRMEPEEAADVRRLMQYPADSAGGLMITEYLAYSQDLCIEDLLADIRKNAEKYREFDVQYAYVVTAEGELVGVLRLRDVLLADPSRPLAELMIRDPLRVDVSASLEDLERFFERHHLFGVPVVDGRGKLVGVVRQHDVQDAAEERSSRAMLKFTGILGGEELRTMPLHLRSFRRLSWLSINIVLNITAASVIAMYQDTLQAMITLAVFLPIISDMSGCSGNQAVAVSMRELSLGLARPRDALRVLLKESSVGMLNGIALGLLLGVIAWLWKGNPALGLVVAGALAVNTLLAACIGGTVPLVLRGLGQDPALASGPILTTLTDMCGFFLVLQFATLAMPLLVS